MRTLATRHQLAIAAVLVALMVVTRGHHFATLKHALPSASWAVFFLAGVYLRPAWALPGMLGLAAFLDYAAIGWGGFSSFCVSPAYVALIPAYGALWLAGRWYAGRYGSAPASLVPLGLSVLAGAFVCELISSGSFYFFSGRFADPTWTEFAGRVVRYFPSFLGAMAFWIAAAAVVHALVLAARNSMAKPAAP